MKQPHHNPAQEKRNRTSESFRPSSQPQFRSPLPKPPIHITPVAYIVHRNLFGFAIDFVDNPIVAHTQTIQSFSTLQLRGLRGNWIDRQAVNPVKKARDDGTGD